MIFVFISEAGDETKGNIEALLREFFQFVFQFCLMNFRGGRRDQGQDRGPF